MSVLRPLRSAVIAALLVVALGCGSDSVPVTTGPLPEFVPPGAPRNRAELATEVAAAQQRWTDAEPSSYSFAILTRCRSCLIDGSTTTVDVEDQRVTSDQNRSAVFGGLPGLFDSIDQVLVAIANAVDAGLVLDASFDSDTGFPDSVTISSEFADRQLDTEIAPLGIFYSLRE